MTSYEMHYFEKRSTPDVQPVGTKPKPQRGWGKFIGKKKPVGSDLTKIRNVTERGQSVSDNWITTRFDGKSSDDPTAKRSKFRPALARLQKKSQEKKRAKVAALESHKRSKRGG